MAVLVHQETDSAAIDAVAGQDRTIVEHLVESVEHEPVTPQRDDCICLIHRHPVVRILQFACSFDRLGGVGYCQCQLAETVIAAHRPLASPCGAGRTLWAAVPFGNALELGQAGLALVG